MPPKRNRGKKPRYPKTGPWSQNMGSGFYPADIMPSPSMNPYMQAAFGVHGPENLFGMRRNNRMFPEDYGIDYQYQEMQNAYFRVSNKRYNNRGFRGRNNRFRRNKRPNAQGGRGSAKKAKTKKQQDQEGNAVEAGNEEFSHDQSSDHGANAPSQDWKNSNDSQTRYCTVCEKDFLGSFFNHRRDINHRRNKDKKYPRCRLCRLTFSGIDEFEAHNETAEHKKMNNDFQVLKQQQLVHASLSDSEDEEVSLQRFINNQEPDNISEDAEAVGQFHIVPLKVYFCKLCQKLFPNYMKGRHVHCRMPAHIQAYKVYFDEKEERVAERNRLKQEKKREKALRKIQMRMEKLAKAKDETEGEGAAESMAVDEKDASSDDDDEGKEQQEQGEKTEYENQSAAEEEQSEEAATDQNAEGDDMYEEVDESQQEWQEEATDEKNADA